MKVESRQISPRIASSVGMVAEPVIFRTEQYITLDANKLDATLALLKQATINRIFAFDGPFDKNNPNHVKIVEDIMSMDEYQMITYSIFIQKLYPLDKSAGENK